MQEAMKSLVQDSVQCWGCAVFDKLFQIVSASAAAIYNKFAVICMIIFCVLFAFFVLNAVWQNIKSDKPDPWFSKTIRPVIINSLIALTLLGGGIMVPRFISQITFEPVTVATTYLAKSIHGTNPEMVESRVTYTPAQISDDGFFRTSLRDDIILLMKTTITQFQSYIMLGIAVMDRAFEWQALLGIGALIKHIILFFMGLYLVFGFFKLFFRYCCYFADVIINMAFFAFFFPLSLMLMSFKDADKMPKWISELGKNVGAARIKNVVSSIVALAIATITYTIIMVIIAKFFSAPGASVMDLMNLISSGEVFSHDLDYENLGAVTLAQAIALVYVLGFIYSQIPQITQTFMETFGVKSENKLSEELADNVMKWTDKAVDMTKRGVNTIFSKGGKK